MQEVTKSAESWLHIVIYPAGAWEGEQEGGEVQQPAAFFAFSFFFFNSPPAAHNFLLHPLVLTFSEGLSPACSLLPRQLILRSFE